MNTMTRSRVLLALACAAAITACSQGGGVPEAKQETGELSWPEITRQNKPWTRWWWPASAVGEADIDTMMVQ